MTHSSQAQLQERNPRKSLQHISAEAERAEGDQRQQWPEVLVARQSARGISLRQHPDLANSNGWHPEAVNLPQQEDSRQQQLDEGSIAGAVSAGTPISEEDGGYGCVDGPVALHDTAFDRQQACSRKFSRDLTFAAATRRGTQVAAVDSTSGQQEAAQHSRSSPSSVGSSNHQQWRVRRNNKRCGANER
jgi:hypothetical protein